MFAGHEGAGWGRGGMLTFLVITSSSSATCCYAAQMSGFAIYMKGWGGGGMLTFLVITSSSSSATGCYVHRCLMSGSRGIHEGVG